MNKKMNISNIKGISGFIGTLLTYLTFVVISQSCTDLTEDLKGDVLADINTGSSSGGDDSKNLLVGPYSKLRDGSAGHGGYFSYQEVSSDEIAITQKGGDWYDGGIWLNTHRHEFKASDDPSKNTWNHAYGGITECNTALANVKVTAVEKAQLRALRAFFYYRLLDVYGRVRLIVSTDEATNKAVTQSTREEVFNFVESEWLAVLGLTKVESGMTITSDLSTTDVKNRINQYAVLGMLSKLYLNAEVYTSTSRWQEAYDAANYVITNSSYSLSDNTVSIDNLGKRPAVDADPTKFTGYAAVFAANNEANPEIIWAIEYDKEQFGGMNFSSMTLHYANQLTYLLQGQPWNGYVVLSEFYNQYDDADERKKANFLSGQQYDYDGIPLIDYAADDDDVLISFDPEPADKFELAPNGCRDCGVRLGKFSYEISGRDDMSNDYPLVRLGELYLIRGEANARNAGDWNNALADVNVIRQRAGLTEDLTSLTADTFFAERGKEMFMEATRRQDLIRFGKWKDAWWEKSNTNSNVLMPIPQEQITASDGKLTQNPGY